MIFILSYVVTLKMLGKVIEGKASEYNPRSKTWRKLPSIHMDQTHEVTDYGPSCTRGYGFTVCTLDKKIYVLGHCCRKLEMLDLTADNLEWKCLAKSKSNHDYSDVVVIDGKIFAFGGFCNHTVEAYDIDKGISMFIP